MQNPGTLLSQLIMTLTHLTESQYGAINTYFVEGLALQMQGSQVIPPGSIRNKVFHYLKLTPYPGFSCAESCHLDTVMQRLSDTI